MHLYTDEGDIDTTANHPFYVIGKGWVAAGDLSEGDEVYNLDGSTSIITGYEVEKLDEPVLVYNLEVEDFHSYFVGCVPVLVHNYKPGNPELPDPNDLPNNEWRDISHPDMIKNSKASRQYYHEQTGTIITFDRGIPGAKGFRGKDHYHIHNPNKKGDYDYYFDINGNLVAKGSKASHILISSIKP